MTRINIGVHPSELCDQMLLAEIRELPRCFRYRTDGGPEQFTLGKGHVLWCARYPGSLERRWESLLGEAQDRGFSVDWSRWMLVSGLEREWSRDDESLARPLLIARIRERLSQMKRTPRWTNRTPPEWAADLTREAKQ